MGLALSDITAESRTRYDLAETTKGVLIVEVDPQGPAAEKGLRPGDVIVEIAQQEVTSPKQASEMIAQAEKAKRKIVLLLVERHGDRRFVGVPLAQE